MSRGKREDGGAIRLEAGMGQDLACQIRASNGRSRTGQFYREGWSGGGRQATVCGSVVMADVSLIRSSHITLCPAAGRAAL